MQKHSRFAATCSLVAVVLTLLTIPAVHPAKAAAPPPGERAGSGNIEGTEVVQDEAFTGAICLKTTKSIFGLRGVGTYEGRTATGQAVVYKAEINTSTQTLYADGPIHIDVENTQTYYHGPNGTHGTNDPSCSAATAGSPVPAEFRIFAAD